MPVNIQLSKISKASAFSCQLSATNSAMRSRPLIADSYKLFVVGLGGIEPPTSPLSGVRSSHLSYRPKPDYILVELVGIEPATS